MKLLQLELLKLRRTLVWPVVLVLPVIPAVMNTLIHRSERFQRAQWDDVLQNGLNTWHLLLLPLVLSLLVAWVLGAEHSGGGWRLNFAAPRPRASVLYAKLGLLLLLSLIMCALMLLSVGLGALTLPTLAGQPDWVTFTVAGWQGWLGSAGLLGLLFLIALRFPSFLMPLGIGIAGMVVGFMGINSEQFGPWWPWTLPTLLGMSEGQNGLLWPSVFSFALTLICLFASFLEIEGRDA